MFEQSFIKKILPVIAISAIAGFVFGFESQGLGYRVQGIGEREQATGGNFYPHEKYLENLKRNLNLNDVKEVFGYVFSGLDSEVMVYPSENYYYFSFYAGGKNIWGNIRLAPGIMERDGGYLNFAYWEFDNMPEQDKKSAFISGYKKIGLKDGVSVSKINPFKYSVKWNNKTVIFNLNEIAQNKPDVLKLRNGEEFVMRTLDESGLPFVLIFDKSVNDFRWILDESRSVPEEFVEAIMPSSSYATKRGSPSLILPLSQKGEENPELTAGAGGGLKFAFLLGKRTDFVFYYDKVYNRKILVGVYAENVKRNNYFDGPFDQLADNSIAESLMRQATGKTIESILKFKDYIELARPYLKGRVDDYGYFLDADGVRATTRIAVTPYYIYTSIADLEGLAGKCRVKAIEDEYSCLTHAQVTDIARR